MTAILSLLAAFVLGTFVFMAYAMVLTVVLIIGVVLALCALLYFGIEQAAQGHNALLIVAVLVWGIGLLVAWGIYRNSNR